MSEPAEITCRHRWSDIDHRTISKALRRNYDPSDWLVFGVFASGTLAAMLAGGLIFGGQSYLAAAIGFGIGLFATSWFLRLRQKKMIAAVSSAPHRQDATETVLSPSGVKITDLNYSAELQWAGIVAISEAPGVILIQTSPIEYLPVPHGALPEGLAPAKALSLLRGWHQDAQSA